MSWNDFERFTADEKYLPIRGEGETKASQIATALNKLVYKWFNDGDVYDNTYHLDGWWNDLSSYANWLYENTTATAKNILLRIKRVKTENEYESLLYDLCVELSNAEYLAEQDKYPKVGSVYSCSGCFEFKE